MNTTPVDVENPPEWAKQRAAELCDAVRSGQANWRPCLSLSAADNPDLHAFARYIAQHEQEPVDPLLGVVEEAIAGTAEKGAIQLREALAKRGLEIVARASK